MMSEDIHKWADGRYTLMFDEHTFFVWDNEKDERMCALNVTKKLNEQQSTISKQLDQIIELQDKYRILEFNHSRLEKRNKAQYEKIGEQQAIIEKLKEENEKLRFLIDINSVSERTKLERQVDEQQSTINDLEKQRDYWKNKAMTLLMQVRRLTSRMTDKEVKEFNKELEDD